ncbi:NUDIX hydrolase [Candidatus Gracilibacteria bacterium]|nr:NUDIX hydrolase [Candidatus Gracilibacteria bacterium]MCF7898330.1 NUDIX hydrolase [Candidatus Paceibacterota bacterium]
MTNSRKGTAEAVLTIALYESESGEIFLPLVLSSERARPSWRIPGGGVEYGEDPFFSSFRELYEETGLIANISFFIETKQIMSGIFHTMTVLKNSWRGSNNRHRQFVHIAEIHDISIIKETTIDDDEKLSVRLFSVNEVIDSMCHNKALEGRRILAAHANILKQAFKELGFL